MIGVLTSRRSPSEVLFSQLAVEVQLGRSGVRAAGGRCSAGRRWRIGGSSRGRQLGGYPVLTVLPGEALNRLAIAVSGRVGCDRPRAEETLFKTPVEPE